MEAREFFFKPDHGSADNLLHLNQYAFGVVEAYVESSL